MIARLLMLALLAAALLALARATAPARDAAPGADFIAPLVPPESVRELAVAGLSLIHGERGYLYLQREGLWRCATAFDAVARTSEVEAVVRDLAEAAGPLRPAEPGRAADYGFDGPDMLAISLHGPGLFEDPLRDQLLAVELGLPLPGPERGRCFARLAGTAGIREIQRNPRALLTSPDDLPPLLDRRVLAGEWPGPGAGVVRAFIDFEDGRGLELRLEQLPPEEVAAGQPAEGWVAIEAGRRSRCLPFRAVAWQSFLFRVPYLGLSNPADAADRGFDHGPEARVTLVLSDASPVELWIGRTEADGRTYVSNEKTGMLCQVERADVPLFAPTVEMMCESSIANPWEGWLRR